MDEFDEKRNQLETITQNVNKLKENMRGVKNYFDEEQVTRENLNDNLNKQDTLFKRANDKLNQVGTSENIVRFLVLFMIMWIVFWIIGMFV